MEEYIKIEIKVETDGDFSLSFKDPSHCEYNLKYRTGKYEFKLKYQWKEAVVKEKLIDFIKDINLDSHKEYLIEAFDKGKEELFKSINEKIFNYHPDILGGGNWSFRVSATRFWIDNR